ncbi:MAG: aminopeptidase P N-terminal domain-containing protein [Candidatus Eremiobacteraeota bacterium]|nr:aminopeptidase P N-terminal domain-containing protein [Candidatus Eremiobacteraeota bacterium]
MQPYDERRERVLTAVADGVAIIPSARTLLRNNDTPYPYRQNSDFFYLTGFNEPEAVLVLAPENDGQRSALFLRERDPERELWDGARVGVERAPAALGVDAAFPISELSERLPALLLGTSTIHYAVGRDEAMDRMIHGALEAARDSGRSKGKIPQRFADPALVLHSMRLIKSDGEIAQLRDAVEITRRGFLAAMRATKAGAFEYEIQAVLEAEYRAAGAQNVAYESIVAGGGNATTLHYVANRDRLVAGELILIDSGCELNCYATDVTRTWPVEGCFNPEQRAIYQLVLAAQNSAIDQVKPGIRRNAFHDAAVATITEGLIDLGLLTGTFEENVEEKRYRQFFMHGTGHWLGLDVHDAGNYRDENDQPICFAPGMVTTVEPGVYIKENLDVPSRFKGIGVRIEDDVLVTHDGNEILTATIPKQIEDLEAVLSSR